MSFSTNECAYKSVRVKMLNRTFVGLQAWEFGKKIDKEYLYGAGDEPIDIQEGNKSYPGSLTLLKYEVDMLNDAAMAAGYLDITEVPHTAITIETEFKKTPTAPMRRIQVLGVAFTDLTMAQQQGAKSTPVQLPYLSMKTILR